MPSIRQILAMLETELSKQLAVSYTLKEHLSRQRSKALLPARARSRVVRRRVRGIPLPATAAFDLRSRCF